ncbi:MAG: hypothetical protein R2867_01675 [Caldilineaceae bacterium]
MFRRIGLILAILVAIVIYAYGFEVTQVNLEELGSADPSTITRPHYPCPGATGFSRIRS